MKSLPTVDAHHHIWRLNDLPWLSGPEVPREDVLDPIIRETVAMFGAGRCFYGSNFPIEKPWTD